MSLSVISKKDWCRPWAVSPQVNERRNPTGRLPLLPATPAVTFPAIMQQPNYTPLWNRHRSVNELPTVVAQKPTTCLSQVQSPDHCATQLHTGITIKWTRASNQVFWCVHDLISKRSKVKFAWLEERVRALALVCCLQVYDCYISFTTRYWSTLYTNFSFYA